MTRKPRTADELSRASNHLYYEIGMFTMLARGMESGISGESAINNALLESFGIHVRALIWFFYADQPRDDDVIAADFFTPVNVWPQARPPLTEILVKAKKRADKEIAHLTYARLDLTPQQKVWDFIPITNDLNNVVKKFLSLVPKDLLGQRWNENKQQYFVE